MTPLTHSPDPLRPLHETTTKGPTGASLRLSILNTNATPHTHIHTHVHTHTHTHTYMLTDGGLFFSGKVCSQRVWPLVCMSSQSTVRTESTSTGPTGTKHSRTVTLNSRPLWVMSWTESWQRLYCFCWLVPRSVCIIIFHTVKVKQTVLCWACCPVKWCTVCVLCDR